MNIYLQCNLQKWGHVLLRPDVESVIFFENSNIFELTFPQEAIDQSAADDYATYKARLAGALIKNLAENTIVSAPGNHAYADFLIFCNKD